MAPAPGSLGSRLRSSIAGALGLLQTRLELLATEFQEEKLRLGSLLGYAAAAFFFLGFGVVLLAAMVPAGGEGAPEGADVAGGEAATDTAATTDTADAADMGDMGDSVLVSDQESDGSMVTVDSVTTSVDGRWVATTR